ncbi:MAG TPA: alpha/beta hydrolase [Acidimicrobiales bacterium]|nr:alpha/beta hydrolase [Acidimicrobiales bacterium]
MEPVDVARSPDGPELAIYDFGGDGDDLLLAHATGFHAHFWLPVVDHLRSSFRCWAFDERGHGRSATPADGRFAWEAYAADALAVVDRLGLSHPVAAGHSCGGALLLIAEADRPGTFPALWCYEPIVFPPAAPAHDGPNPLAAGARRRRATFPSFDAAYDNYAAKPPFDRLAPEALRAYVDHGFEPTDPGDDRGEVTLRCRPEDEAATYEMGRSHCGWDVLPTIGCPVVVASGETSDAVPPAIAERQVDRLPHGRVEVMTGLGHFGPGERPDQVAASIIRALA